MVVFTTEGILQVAKENWPEWDLKPQPLIYYIYAIYIWYIIYLYIYIYIIYIYMDLYVSIYANGLYTCLYYTKLNQIVIHNYRSVYTEVTDFVYRYL